jgi:hypothetical protein
MTAIDATHTLAELVTDHPGLARLMTPFGVERPDPGPSALLR